MKKVMLVIVCLVFAASAFAQQSDPSNDVGYVKLNINGSGTPGVISSLPFGLPFKFWTVNAGVPQYGTESTKPSSIIGAQTNPGAIGAADRINRVDNGQFAYRTVALAWSGGLETTGAGLMIPGRGYQYINKTGAARTLVLAGDVDNSGDYGIVTITAPVLPALLASTPYSWRDSRNSAISTLNLLEDGFTGGTIGNSDRVAQTTGGNFAYYNTGTAAWAGGLTAIVPGQYYNIVNKHAVWSYSYDGTAAAAMNAGVALPAAAPITKMPVVGKDSPTVKTSSVKTVKTTSSSK